MSADPIYYSEVLSDLRARRESLNSRMSSIDSAIESINTLLDQGAVRPSPPSVEQTQVSQASAAHWPAAVQVQSTPADRRKKATALNVYVNPYPEWSRTMAQGRSVVKRVVRKQAGIRCPKCGSCDTRQSFTRGLSDFLLFLFDFINARCRNCNGRFRVWKTPAAQEMLGEPVAETE